MGTAHSMPKLDNDAKRVWQIMDLPHVTYYAHACVCAQYAEYTWAPPPQKRPLVDDDDEGPAAKVLKTTQSERHSSRTDVRKSLGAFSWSQKNQLNSR